MCQEHKNDVCRTLATSSTSRALHEGREGERSGGGAGSQSYVKISNWARCLRQASSSNLLKYIMYVMYVYAY